MIETILLITTLISAGPQPSCVELSVVNTTEHMERRGCFYVSGGSYWKKVSGASGIAVVMRRQDSNALWLYDAGMASTVKEQLKDTTWWYRIFSIGIYTLRRTVKEALGPETAQVQGIVMSHLHFDHISGAADFPGVPIYVSKEHIEWVDQLKHGKHAVFPKVFERMKKDFRQVETAPMSGIEPFQNGLDFFEDGSVILIPTRGHTVGELMMLARTCDGAYWFFISDVTWKQEGVEKLKQKFWLVRRVADVDTDAIMEELKAIGELAGRFDAQIIPSHDPSAFQGIPEYPSFR